MDKKKGTKKIKIIRDLKPKKDAKGGLANTGPLPNQPAPPGFVWEGTVLVPRTPSSARFKDEIKPMDKASEAILALKPVSFRYKKNIDPAGAPQFGLVAEQVDKVDSDLVVRDKDGRIYSVRYEAVNAMLLNEFLKEHQKVQRLEAALAAVNERLKEQDAKINKVSAKVELTKLAPQVANNDQ
jgi:hypothetical protein